jgi:sugar phosphate isomerase/epimerase
MSCSHFRPGNVGLCLSTLFADPRAVTGPELEDALRLCGDLGFREICLGPGLARALGADRIGAVTGEIGARVRVIEAITAWTDGTTAAAEEARRFLELASALRADTLLAATIAPTIQRQQAAEGFAAACDLAREYGVRIGLEFIPGTGVPDLATAWDLARQADEAGAGVVVDMLHWHHQPGGPAFDTLRKIPAGRIVGLQVCDSPPGVTPPGEQYLAFAMTARALPGDGVVDIDALLRALDGMGADPYVAAEVFNRPLAGQGAEVVLRRLRRAIDRLFGDGP